ncbi:MAG: fasciclin domain-containing protein [Chloroflexota bacterium]
MHKRNILIMVLLSLLLVFPVVAQDDTDEEGTNTISQIVADAANADDPQFTALLNAIEEADPAVVGTLGNPEATVTVFAPTDAAFEALSVATEEEALLDILDATDELSRLLLYHVIEGEYTSEDLVAQFEEEGEFTLRTMEGQYVEITGMDDEFFVDDARLLLEMSDIQASNGVIHVIDAVLVPEMDTIGEMVTRLASSAENPQFTQLLSAFEAADPAVMELLSDPTAGVTVFAPTDEAFNALEDDTRSALFGDVDRMTTVLQYHVTDGLNYEQDILDVLVMETMEIAEEETDDTEDAGEAEDTFQFMLETLTGENLTVRVEPDNTVTVNGVRVVTFDIEARNGVIHAIDSVLIPPTDDE